MTTYADPTPPPTTPVADSHARQQVVELVEDALRRTSFCQCGAPMTVEADGDTLLLECPTFIAPSTGRLAWLRRGIRATMHERLVIGRELGIAA